MAVRDCATVSAIPPRTCMSSADALGYLNDGRRGDRKCFEYDYDRGRHGANEAQRCEVAGGFHTALVIMVVNTTPVSTHPVKTLQRDLPGLCA